MFVERLKEAEIAEILNKIKEIASKDCTKITENELEVEKVEHDTKNFLFVKSKSFMKCWMSDFTCATRIFDASAVYRKIMAQKFGDEYIDAYWEELNQKSNEENEMKINMLKSTIEMN